MSDVKLGTVKVEDELLKVRCKDGWLVAGYMGDPGEYDEIVVYLEADDGRTLQLAVVGCNDCDYEDAFMRSIDPEWEPMHVYAYDGMHDDVAKVQYVKVCEESYWD